MFNPALKNMLQFMYVFSCTPDNICGIQRYSKQYSKWLSNIEYELLNKCPQFYSHSKINKKILYIFFKTCVKYFTDKLRETKNSLSFHFLFVELKVGPSFTLICLVYSYFLHYTTVSLSKKITINKTWLLMWYMCKKSPCWWCW